MSFTVKSGYHPGTGCDDYTALDGTSTERVSTSLNFYCDDASQVIDSYYDQQDGYYDDQGDPHPTKCEADPPGSDGAVRVVCHFRNVTADGDDGAQMYRSYVAWTEVPATCTNNVAIAGPQCSDTP